MFQLSGEGGVGRGRRNGCSPGGFVGGNGLRGCGSDLCVEVGEAEIDDFGIPIGIDAMKFLESVLGFEVFAERLVDLPVAIEQVGFLDEVVNADILVIQGVSARAKRAEHERQDQGKRPFHSEHIMTSQSGEQSLNMMG